MLKYKIDILWELKMKGYNTNRIRQEGIMGGNVMKKLYNGEMIGIHIIDRVCGLLGLQPGDIIEYVPDDAPLFAAAPIEEEEGTIAEE